MQSRAQRYTFYAVSIISIVSVMMTWSAVARLWDASEAVRCSGLTITFTLFMMAWIYPLKRFNEEGSLVGMHREALQASGLFAFITISMPVEERWGVNLSHWGSMMLFVGTILLAILLYQAMLLLLSRSKQRKSNKACQGNPLGAPKSKN